MKRAVGNCTLSLLAVCGLFCEISKPGIARILSLPNPLEALKSGYSPPDLWGSSALFLSAFIAFAFAFDRLTANVGARKFAVCLAFSALFSLSATLGECITLFGGIEPILSGGASPLFAALAAGQFAGGAFLFLPVPLLAARLAERYPIGGVESRFPFAKTFAASFALYFAIWLLFAAVHGLAVQFDTAVQLNECVSGRFTRDNPIFLTLMLDAAIGAFGMKAGLWAFSVLQMSIFAAACAYATAAIAELGAGKFWIWAAALFFALHPFNAVYAVAPGKDTFLAAFCLLYAVVAGRLATGKLKLDWRGAALLFAAMSGMFFSKNVGVVAGVMSVPFMLFAVGKNRARFLLAAVAAFAAFYCASRIAESSMKLSGGKPVDMYSSLVQQAARIAAVHGGELPQETTAKLSKLMPFKDWGQRYDPHIADPVKGGIDKAEFVANRPDYLKLWLGMAAKYPLTAFDALACGSAGYWHCDVIYGTIPHSTYAESRQAMADAGRQVFLPQIDSPKSAPMSALYGLVYALKLLPVVSLAFSLGFCVWALALCLMLVAIRREYGLCVWFAFPALIWASCVLSPVHAELRYALGLFVLVPYAAALAFYRAKENSDRPSTAVAPADSPKTGGQSRLS